MFSLGMPEILMILAVALIVFGPRRLPEIGRTIGKTLAELRRATDDLKHTIEREVQAEEIKQIVPSMMAPIEAISRAEPGMNDEHRTLNAERGADGAEDRPRNTEKTDTDLPPM